MIGLIDSKRSSIPCLLIHVRYEGTRKPTQLLLKQSCEQNVLSFPSFRQVGHWRVPASLLQSAPIQRFLLPSVAAMTKQPERIRTEEVKKNVSLDVASLKNEEARATSFGKRERESFIFRQRAYGGRAWTRVSERGGKNGNYRIGSRDAPFHLTHACRDWPRYQA